MIRNLRVTCSLVHVVTWGQVTNKKRFISISMIPYPTKLEMVMAYEKGSPPTIVAWKNSHVTSKKSYISVSTWLISTKSDKVMVYGIGPPCTKSHDFSILWFHVVSYQNKKRYICNSLSPLDDKLKRVVVYDMRLTLKKSHHS